MSEKGKREKVPFITKAITAALSLLILYTLYHIFFGLSDSVATTPAGLVRENSFVVLDGIIFRDEEPLNTENEGTFRPYLSDGELASVGATVCAVYSKKHSDDIVKEAERLERELKIYKESNASGFASVPDIERLNAEIDKLYGAIMTYNARGENTKARSLEDDLLIALNKMNIYEGKVKNYNEQIKDIEQRLDAVYASLDGEPEYICAGRSGYFYHSCDGYENDLTLEMLASLTPSELIKMTEDVKREPTKKSKYICKLVYGSIWRIAMYCNNATAQLLEEGNSYDAVLFDAREREIRLLLEKKSESDGEGVLLVFSCSTMPDGFDYTRYQEVRLNISSVEGYRVPKKALVTVTDKENGEKKTGVYVLNASVVSFKRVDIIAESEGYYIVARLDKENENYREYLDLNDLIVLDTDEMYDGRVLRK